MISFFFRKKLRLKFASIVIDIINLVQNWFSIANISEICWSGCTNNTKNSCDKSYAVFQWKSAFLILGYGLKHHYKNSRNFIKNGKVERFCSWSNWSHERVIPDTSDSEIFYAKSPEIRRSGAWPTRPKTDAKSFYNSI